MGFMVIHTTELLPYLSLIGVILLVGEFFLPTKGILGILGVMCFVVGTIHLTHLPDPELRLSKSSFYLLNVLVIGTAAAILYFVHKGYTSKKADAFSLEGQYAIVADWNQHNQRVEIGGAFWQAITQDGQKLKHGQTVRVIKQDNLTLIVEPVGDNP